MREAAVREELAAGWQWLQQLASWLGSAVQSSAVQIIGVVAVVVLVLSRRYRLHRVLSERVTVELCPSEGFSTSLDHVQAVARRWAQVRPGRRRLLNWGWRPKAGCALRISLVTDREGLLRYRVTAPAHAAGLLTAPTYPAVETRVVHRDGDSDEIPSMAAWRESLPDRMPTAHSHGGRS